MIKMAYLIWMQINIISFFRKRKKKRQHRNQSSLYAMLSLPTIPLQASPCFHISLGLSELQTALPTLPEPQKILSALSRRPMHALQPLLLSQRADVSPSYGCCQWQVPPVLPYLSKVPRQQQSHSHCRCSYRHALLKRTTVHSDKTQTLPITKSDRRL